MVRLSRGGKGGRTQIARKQGACKNSATSSTLFQSRATLKPKHYAHLLLSQHTMTAAPMLPKTQESNS